ncbi:hypothetical protein OH76DRAFT_1404664 [Lentinus brumalis]|uniref:Uncharacterized protein n=1 Tax=Lentinus brumalis TaxID=2498619 RepID=A0A371D872_9APHY|nr:hypothetical protein OH76DRAFT_1404664 [Polyporus brumalis]
MASYEGLRTYDALPDVLKLHFAITVSPHCEVCPGDGHLHTTPEWQNPHIWLVGIPFASNAHVAGRWGWKDASRLHQNDKGFIVEEKIRHDMTETFQLRMDGWMTSCWKQKDYSKRCKEEYDRFKNATLWARYLEERERARNSVDAATSLTAPENVLQQDLAGNNTSTRKEGNSGTSSALPRSEPTLAGSASDLEKKDTAGTQALQSAANSTQGNGGTPGADDDGQGPWKTVEPPKKSNKLRKPRQPERQRTVSGIGPMFSEIVGSLKGRTMQSHR